MSYSQYEQYGGNPYNNGPEAEGRRIGGPVCLLPHHSQRKQYDNTLATNTNTPDHSLMNSKTISLTIHTTMVINHIPLEISKTLN